MTKLQLKPVKMFNYPLTEEQEFKRSNIFNSRPKGFIIFDSYNNPFYQLIQVDLDDAKLSYTNIKQELKRKNWRGYFMPWHYWVEMVGIDYITIQSRPLNYRSALPGYEDYICICIAGNSSNDIYMKTLYKNIADIIMSSLHYMPGWKLNGHDETLLINLGRAFDHHQLEKMLR
jgi:hypothetical protein